MLAKPLTFMLVFILTIANFIVLLAPISILFFPAFIFFKSLFIKIGYSIFFFLVSRISGAIILYIALDTILGFTVRRMRKGCIKLEKASAIHGYEDILESFQWLKDKFKISKVSLYIDPNFDIENAYAIGSFSESTITITMGLINRIHENSDSYEDFIDSIRSILGHEMSHLANKDFLPGLLTSASESASRYVSKLVKWVFIFFSTIFKILPWFGWSISQLIISIYNITNLIIMAFYNIIFNPFYNFLINLFGRSIEFRCDRESAYAYGGQRMAKALSMLGGRGYFSLFSTHPSTASRIRNVRDVLPIIGPIKPSLINIFSDFISLVLVVIIFAYSTSLTNVPNMYEHYIDEVYHPIKSKTEEYSADFRKFYIKFKPFLEKLHQAH